MKDKTNADKGFKPAVGQNQGGILFDNNPLPMWVYNLETYRFLAVNHAAVEHYGYSEAEFKSMTLKDIRPQEDVERLVKDLQQKRPSLQDSGVWRHRRKDGSVIEVEIHSHTLEYAGRNAALVVAMDVTERRRTERALRESEERFRALIENGRDNISMLAADGALLWESPSTNGTLGYASNQFVGGNIFELMHPDDIAWTQNLFEQVVRTPGESKEGVFRLRHNDGSWRWIEATATNLLDEPHVQAIVVNYRDITDRKRAEQALQDSQAQLHGVIASAMDAIITIDAEQRILLFNPAAEQMFRCSVEEVIGESLERFIPEYYRAQHQAAVRAFGESNSTRRSMATPTLGLTCLRADGEAFPSEVSISQSEFDGQKLYTAIVRDITERRLAEEEIRRSEDRYRDLVEHIHDLIGTHDLQGNILSINPAAAKLLGIDDETLLKMNLRDLLAPEARGRFNDYLSAIQRDGRASGIMLVQTKSGDRRIWEYDNTLRADFVGGPIVRALARDITEQKQAEQSLRESEARYRAIFDGVQDAILVESLDGRILAVNDRACEMYGFSRADLLAKTVANLVPEGHVSLTVDGAARELSPEHLETVNRRANGDTFPIEISGRLQTINGEDVLLVVVRDITERKRAEAALQQAEKKYRNIFENAMEAITQTTPEGRYITANPATARILGYDSLEDLMSSVNDLNTQFYVEPGRREEFKKLMEEQGSVVGFESEVYRKDGSRVWVSENMSTVRDERGTLLYYEGTSENITERKKAEEALRQSEMRLKMAFEAAHAGAWEWDMNANRVVWSDENFRVLGLQPGSVEPAYEKWLACLHPEDRVPAEAAISRAVEQKSDLNIEFRIIWPDGSVHWINDIGSIILDAAGQPQRMIGLQMDITARRQAEDATKRRLVELTVLQKVAEIGERAAGMDELLGLCTRAVNESLYPDSCGILLFDEAANVLHPHPSYRGVTEEENRRISIPLGRGVTGRVAADRRPLRVADVSREREYLDINLESNSELCVPILSGEKLLGVLNAESSKPDYFTDSDESLLLTIAGELATAIEKIRVLEEERRRLVELATLHENGMAISGLLDPEIIARDFIQILRTRLDWHHAVVRLKLPDSDALQVIGYSAPGLEAQDRPAATERLNRAITRVGEGMTGWVVQHGQAARSGDLPSDPRYIETYPGIRSGVYAPMKVGEEIVGAVGVESEQAGAFTEHAERLLVTLAAQVAVAIQNARLFTDAQRRLRRTQALREIDKAIAGSMHMHQVLNITLDHTIAELGVDAAVVLLLDPRDQTLKYESGRGLRTEALRFTRLEPGEGYAGKVALEKRTVFIPDLRTRTTDFLRSPSFSQEGFACYFGVPLIAKDEVVGVLEIFHRAALEPDKEWLDFMETLAGQIAIAIDNATLYRNLQRSNVDLTRAYEATIEGWSKALDLRDKETEGHTQRVTSLTLKLAREMGVPEAEMIHIRRGALLHDIGKMGVPDSILLKPDKLTEEEWLVMRRHPAFAYEMLLPISYLKPALDIPYCHHEKWDGSGYSRGLKGEQIPLAARIFAVVDVWDALRSDRPYREGWPVEKTRQYILEKSGKHFDPRVIEAFLPLIDNE